MTHDDTRALAVQATLVTPESTLGVPPLERQVAFERVLGRMIGAPRREVRIGRYELVRRLGAGGMGVVYLVRDPDLDRLVALKVLHPNLARDPGSDAIERRMRREARAMARLDHPNVVRVLEVGEHEGRTYLVMEYVAGTTLARWLHTPAARDWRAVVEVFLAAGEGLKAAHAANLAHCDFKPDNVLLGDNGAIKVSDFGLVRVHETAETHLPTVPLTRVGASTQTTMTSELCGTPAFMAPEQFSGQRGDHLSDQFSFCVALYTALHGEPPFRGDSLLELERSVRDGLKASPSAQRVPAVVRTIVARGLEVDPAARWSSMDELLARLRAALGARARRRRRAALGVVSLALLSVGAMALQRHHARAERAAACAGEGASIRERWRAGQHADVREGILMTGASFAAGTADKVTPWLDRYVEEWERARVEVCLDATVRARVEPETLERARWCLDGRALQLTALVEALSRANPKVVQKAITAASALDPVSPCTDPAFLTAMPALPPEDARAEFNGLRAELARAWTLIDAGDEDLRASLIEAASRRAEALAWPPLIVETRRLRAAHLAELGEYEASVTLGAEVYSEAARAGVWSVAAAAADDVARVTGYRLARPAEARIWSRSAEAVGHLAHDPIELRRAGRLTSRSIIEERAGEHAEAKALAERALALREAALGPEHPLVASALIDLANAQKAMADYAGAQATYERALAIRRVTSGEHHPDTAVVLNNLAVNHMQTGDRAGARALFEQVLAIRSQVLGDRHPDVARVLVNVGATLYGEGELDAAVLYFERASEIFEATLGPEHPDLAKVLSNLAAIQEGQGDLRGAVATGRRAVEVLERALGPEHPNVAQALLNLASAQ
ncbi:MAG: serine/threonine protein kinase, partial [Myxococcales bacterium]|nr:serine/threonine protein kinase [Myxococcales bacterium]